jgi:hypothetical protein
MTQRKQEGQWTSCRLPPARWMGELIWSSLSHRGQISEASCCGKASRISRASSLEYVAGVLRLSSGVSPPLE